MCSAPCSIPWDDDPRIPGVNPLWRSRLAHFSPSWDFTLVPVRMRDWNIARASRTAENCRELPRTGWVGRTSHARRQNHVGMCKTKTSSDIWVWFQSWKAIQVSTLSFSSFSTFLSLSHPLSFFDFWSCRSWFRFRSQAHHFLRGGVLSIGLVLPEAGGEWGTRQHVVRGGSGGTDLQLNPKMDRKWIE